MTLEHSVTLLEVLRVGVCLFCAHLLLVRRRDPGVYLPLALFFLFHGSATLVLVLTDAAGAAERVGALMRVNTLFALLEIPGPFLFWLYVRGLTSEGDATQIPKLRYHLVPIGVATLLFGSVMFLPEGVDFETVTEDHPAMPRILLIILAMLLADFLFMGMIATYLVLTIRRLRAYRTRLKDVFASTENRELSWIWLITISGGIFWIMSLALSAALLSDLEQETRQSDWIGLFEELALLGLFWVIGIWGLRQRPGLIRAPMVAPRPPETPLVQKYEKSALDDTRAARIARKIEAAMTDDQLYREPNLSLWDLAQHIGTTSHYVSQTLNTQIGSSFFDYINRWRIKDAVEQLTSTSETILVIAYDVGFNSRSAFYKAFKRETGKTPSDLRK